MILLRSSSRCSRKLIAGRASGELSPGGSSATISDILRLGQGIQRRFQRCPGFGLPRSRGYRAGYGLGWQNRLFLTFFEINLIDLGFDLRFKFVGGALEFSERTPYLTA